MILKRGEEESRPLHQIEKQVLGLDHCEIGAILLERWNLSLRMREMIRHYQKPVLANSSVKDASLIHLADFLSESLGMGNAGDSLVPEFSEAAWGHSGLSEERLPDIVEELQLQFEEVCAILLSDN